ncbi:phage portal protein [Heyndrickxia oleronia]|uniref:phage portal protein n=1 Tax=Heyndrickxia oleronia TaxID=38875 RepID=UPI00203C73CF|nr:phage portal protein [Heyndrickxia oleronia]MCM3454464.1 phage portal protein [Heyndrickxia oleronia]
MKWTSRLKGAFKAAVAGWKGKTFDFSSWFGRKFWGIDNSKLATNETIFSVISRLANTLSSLPLKLYQNYDIVMNQAADVVINTPNPNMSGFDWINKIEVSRNETGNGYAVIMRDIRMQVEALVPLDSSYVTPFINTDDNNLWYQVQGVGGTYYFHNMNMFHVKHITGTSRWAGISPLDVLKNTLEYDKAVQEFSLSEMQKKDSFILTYGSNVDEDKRQEIINDFKRFYQDNGGILFQEPGVEIEKMTKEYFASDTLASERITRSRVANVFNVPVLFLNDTEGQSYGSNEQLMIQFVNMTVLPIVRQYEAEMNRKLLTDHDRKEGCYFKFNLGGLLRGDTAARTQFYQVMLRGGGMSPDDVRRLEDLPPKGGKADQLWISGDLYPIDMDPAQRKGVKGSGETEKE